MAQPVAIAVDIETTGLSIQHDHIIEVAVCVVGNDRQIIDYENSIVVPGDSLNAVDNLREGCDDFVREMHDHNGLWCEMRMTAHSTEHTLSNVAERISSMLRNHGLSADNRVPLLGSSPGGLDRPMLEKDMPQVAAALTHHSIDATTFEETLRCFHGYTDEMVDEIKAETDRRVRADSGLHGVYMAPHRAMYDIVSSLHSISVMEDHLHRARG